MTGFLTLIALALLGIAVWQIVKIYDLSQVNAPENNQIATEKDNHINGFLMMGFLIFLYGLTIFSMLKWGKVLLPLAASKHGEEVDRLMIITFALILFVQGLTQVLLHYFAYKYRGKKGMKALFYADNDKLEFLWTIIPVITLSGLIIYGLWTWTNIMRINEDDDPIIIELYAQQFNWKVRYAGADNTLGDANVRFIEGSNVIGVDISDPNGKDDIVVTQELRLPVGRKVIFKMRSQDVLHSAFMPFFRAQMNVVPGMITQFSFTPIQTTEQARQDLEIIGKVQSINNLREEKNVKLSAEGKELLDPYEFNFLLLCNKICGASHYNMQLNIIVDTPEDFNQWISQQKTISEVLQ
ncbi:MAG: cytochrome C oxidase subunit II [Flavobacteriales bacterium CG_4_9_14_3_um_filter_40_17]|nr:MAG: cytochrome C oxidase subunit II [Flavobacteriales bacterium CG_4_9_14_3_um_filter_40_17]